MYSQVRIITAKEKMSKGIRRQLPRANAPLPEGQADSTDSSSNGCCWCVVSSAREAHRDSVPETFPGDGSCGLPPPGRSPLSRFQKKDRCSVGILSVHRQFRGSKLLFPHWEHSDPVWVGTQPCLQVRLRRIRFSSCYLLRFRSSVTC